MSIPAYQRIKDFILDQIQKGTWLPGAQVPSENQLVEQFSVSRMTARRALNELSDQGFLKKAQGLGTFVADSRPLSSILVVKSIAEEVRERGHRYSNNILDVRRIEATALQATSMGIQEGDALFESTMVHHENGTPIQFEHRLVNPVLVPEYDQQDFNKLTPNEYLSQVAPLTEAELSIEAVLPNNAVGLALEVSNLSPCLKVTRKTFSQQGIVSMAELIHPGSRYRLGSKISVSQ